MRDRCHRCSPDVAKAIALKVVSKQHSVFLQVVDFFALENDTQRTCNYILISEEIRLANKKNLQVKDIIIISFCLCLAWMEEFYKKKLKELKVWTFIYRRLQGSRNNSGSQCEVAH